MNIVGLKDAQRALANALADIALSGPVPSTGNGDMAVGKTLLDLLGIQQTTTRKPKFHDIVITARRNKGGADGNRVNLFAMVPNWKLSTCKSSKEIALRYGYDRDGGRKLYVSVRSRRPNAQGLFLEVDRKSGLLREKHHVGNSGQTEGVAVWQLPSLQKRLLQRHPASAWITANEIRRENQVYFHYRFVKFTDEPNDSILPDLIDQGTVTMDHLIFSKDGRTVEKGPLFKIRPDNFHALFPTSPRYDLMTF